MLPASRPRDAGRALREQTPGVRPPPPVVVVPGLGGSDERHWQSRWQAALPGATRFRPSSWDAPQHGDWRRALAAAVAACPAPPVLVAHSLGCFAAAELILSDPSAVAAALLVAPPDPDAPAFPPRIASFRPLRRERLGVRAVLVGSGDDPYGSPAFIRALAADWGARAVDAGALGHINSDSRIGDWPAGRALLDDLLAGR